MARRNLKQEHERRVNHRALLLRNDERHRVGAAKPKTQQQRAAERAARKAGR